MRDLAELELELRGALRERRVLAELGRRRVVLDAADLVELLDGIAQLRAELRVIRQRSAIAWESVNAP